MEWHRSHSHLLLEGRILTLLQPHAISLAELDILPLVQGLLHALLELFLFLKRDLHLIYPRRHKQNLPRWACKQVSFESHTQLYGNLLQHNNHCNLFYPTPCTAIFAA